MASRFLLIWLRIATNKILYIMVKLADLAKHNYVGVKSESIVYSWIARDVIALIVKPLDVKIADQHYVNACKNTHSL